MNRLLRMSFDTFLTSVTPILGYFLLGILVDKNLINIFSLMYPIQFVITSIQSIFGTGANISAIRDKNKNYVFTGFTLGALLGAIILGSIIGNIDHYIRFMNLAPNTYRIFAIYAIGQMFLQLLLNLALCKLYYEDKNKQANHYAFFFNLINFVTLISASLITQNQIIIAGVAFGVTTLFTLFIIGKSVRITNLKINLKNCIKYDSVNFFAMLSMFLIYLFGLKNAFNFGDKYVLAISFATLITDTQWDIAHVIRNAAQIDITKRLFSYREHARNGRHLTYLLILSTMVMGLILYPSYQCDLTATLIFVSVELISLFYYHNYIIKFMFIQLEYSALQATIHMQIAKILRIACSFIPSPFCTTLGLALSVVYQLGATHLIIKRHKLCLEMKPT